MGERPKLPEPVVGAEVTIRNRSRVRGAEPTYRTATIAKIGRRWIYLSERDSRYDREDGIVEGWQMGRVITPEIEAWDERVREARGVIAAAGLQVRLGHSAAWPEERVAALADWLRGGSHG